MVVKIAFQFRRQWADVLDLIAEGNVGLAEAIRKFNVEKGIPFPSYARYWIRARILAAAGTFVSPSEKNGSASSTGIASTSLMSRPPKRYSSTAAWNRRAERASAMQVVSRLEYDWYLRHV